MASELLKTGQLRNDIGVIQGRLLPKYQGRYQAHPIGYWQEEFWIAKKIGLDCIEFIFDYNNAEKNPLLEKGGSKEILEICERTGVLIKTICADYLMEAPLHGIDDSVSSQSVYILHRLLDASSMIGVTDIVIPCVDQATINSTEAVNRFIEKIRQIIPVVEKKEIRLSLETDLDPQSFVDLLERINSDQVTVNYDVGNSAALGYDLVEELGAYGSRITDIHIKDRLLGGGPVMLGEGDADFDLFFRTLKEFNYQGPFIMQAYRDEEGIEVFKQQLNWVLPYFNKLYD